VNLYRKHVTVLPALLPLAQYAWLYNCRLQHQA